MPETVKQDRSNKNIQEFPASRPILESAVNQAIPYYENDRKRFTLLAEKCEEMEWLNLNPKYTEAVVIQKKLYEAYGSQNFRGRAWS